MFCFLFFALGYKTLKETVNSYDALGFVLKVKHAKSSCTLKFLSFTVLS